MTSEIFKELVDGAFNDMKDIKHDLKNNFFTTPSANSCMDNIVSASSIREVQKKVIGEVADAVGLTFGPMGSYTKIISGSDANSIVSRYSKDGHTVLKHILYNNPIEMSIRAELEEITRHVELEIGDGTTSAILLTNDIFNLLLNIMDMYKNKIPPYKILDIFKKCISSIQETILSNKKEITGVKDIYDICMISTNSNDKVSTAIADIYEKYGFGVELSVSISNTKNDQIKIYDGLTLSTGYSDPCYINCKEKGTCELYNPEIYAFKDPIDTPEMINLFGLIIDNNIIEPLKLGDRTIPTVILTPKMSRDVDTMLGPVVDTLNILKNPLDKNLLILTDIMGSDEAIYLDVAKLCGCKYIKKYIDPKIKELDMEKGLVPNENNIRSFAGKAENVVSDISKTKFVNPSKMHNEDGTPSDEYNALIAFLEAELDHAKANGEDDRSISYKKKRLNSLKSNMVEYLVGGITIADRDSLKDLVIDAVKNCKSACEKGYGYAANFEGLRASANLFRVVREYENLCKKKDHSETELYPIMCQTDIAAAIFCSYYNITERLYYTAEKDIEIVHNMIVQSITDHHPFNLKSFKDRLEGKTVLTSIDTDIKILEAISKLVSLMATSNQCLLQAPSLNTYNI